jgi:hypothetical protein
MSEQQVGPEVPEQVIKRIQALLNKTHENGCTENEAAEATVLARQMLVKHKLDMDVVLNYGKGEEDPTTHEVISMGIDRGVSCDWCFTLGRAVAEVTFCKPLYYVGSREIIFIGKKTDVQVAKDLYTFIAQQGLQLCERSWKIMDRWDRREFKGYGWYRLPFMMGVASRIATRFNELKKQDEAKPEVVALVRMSEIENEDYVKKEFKVRKGSNAGYKGDLSYRAMAEGRAAADKIKLQKDEALPDAKMLKASG